MIQLRNSSGDPLSLAIKNLSPEKREGQVVKNRLIDGTYHVQSIGTPARSRDFKILANENQVDEINNAEAIGNLLTLEIDGIIYNGFVDSQPSWERFTMRHITPDKRLYTTDLTINIVSGG